MKKYSFAIILVVLCILLAACNNSDNTLADNSLDAGQNSVNTEIQNGTADINSDLDSQAADDINADTGRYDDGTRLYVTADTIVFEIDNAQVEQFNSMKDTMSAQDTFFVEFTLPQFEAVMTFTAGQEDFTVSYTNKVNGQNVTAYKSTEDERLSWSISGQKLQLVCKEHGYDIAPLFEGDGYYSARMMLASEMFSGGGPLENYPIKNELPQ